METFIELNKILNDIKNKGFIKQKYLDSRGTGKMLEKLLGKKLDNKSKPDYKDVELKVSNKNTKYPVSLISITPKNSINVNSIEYLIKNFSHNGCDEKTKNNKYINGIISTKVTKYTNKNTGFKLELNKNDKKIYLLIIKNKKIISKDLYWDLNEIKEKIEQKIKYLVLVIAETKKINKITHCKYNEIMYYKLRNFDFFIDALQKGYIKVTFSIKMNENNKITYHGTRFCIDIKNLINIYMKVHIKAK